MFYSARLKLTAWYLLIIMLISILFSIAFYNSATKELRRVIHFQEVQQQAQQDNLYIFPQFQYVGPTLDDLKEVEYRFRLILISLNVGIFILSGAAAYFLAGRTLRPIQEMVDEQNRFITDASHELRTPLTALRSEIEVSLRDKALALPEAKQLLKSNLEEVMNLQALSDNLLHLSQFESPRKRSNYTVFSLQDCIEEAERKILPLAKRKKITLVKTIADVDVKADEVGLGEVLVILLDNAVKYSPARSTISIISRRTDHSVKIMIQDEGEGISPEDLPHIFDRFYRVDKSRGKNEVSGYGLGLAIAKKIITAHKGMISVKSTVGKGTTFTLLLPILASRI